MDQYDYLVSNSRYIRGWIKKKWGLDATHLIYPPVEMEDGESDPEKKEPISLPLPGSNRGAARSSWRW